MTKTQAKKAVVKAARDWADVFSFKITPKLGCKNYADKAAGLEAKANNRLFEAVEDLQNHD